MITKQKNAGFTLIELLVVISIIGVLSTLAVVSLNNARVKARDVKRVSDVKQLQTALELYASDKNGYPAGTDLVLGTGAGATLSSDSGFASTPSGAIYMSKVPINASPGGADYTYNSYTSSAATTACNTAPCVWYELTFELEQQTGSLTIGPHTLNPDGAN